MATITPAPALLAGRSLLAPEMFDRLERRIRAEHPDLTPDMPGRILDQALAFLAACAVTTKPIGPSPAVDIGWHTFILYTVDYAAFCQRIAGRFIHHVPDEEAANGPAGESAKCDTECQCNRPPLNAQTDQDGTGSEDSERGTLKMTVQAIRAAGYRVDRALWPASATADCTQCHAGCHDSPTRN